MNINGINKSEANMLRKNIQAIKKQKFTLDFDFCKLVYYSANAVVNVKGKDIPFYEHCGYEYWENFVHEEINITLPRAKAYNSIYEKYAVELKSAFKPSHIIDLRKMETLLPIVDKSNLSELISTAKTMTKADLNVLVNPEKAAPIRNKLSFSLNKTENRVYNKALKIAAKEFGELDDHELLIAVLADYIENNTNGKLSATN